LTRLNAAKQQALANSNQRAAELQKRTTELEEARAELTRVRQAATNLEERLAASETTSNQLREETHMYRERFSSLERDLETMREVVGRDLQDSNDCLMSIKDENAQLRQRNAELSQELEHGREQPSQTPRAATPQNYSGHFPPAQHPIAESFDNQIAWGLQPLHAPQSQYGYPQSELLESQQTGSLQGTVVSRVASRAGMPPLRPDPSGWWG